MLLAIDTSAGTSAAVVSNRVLSLAQFDDPFGHAENVGLAISMALSEAGVTAADISGVVVGRGPAPYTGLRVGIAAGVALAHARSLPIYGVMVLDAVAHATQESKLLLFADAKRKEVFAAAYEDSKRTFGPAVMLPEELKSFDGFKVQSAVCNAGLLGLFANHQLANGVDLSDYSAIYLRSPDVSPSPGKKVSG